MDEDAQAGSSGRSASSSAAVPSLDPSSTKMISNAPLGLERGRDLAREGADVAGFVLDRHDDGQSRPHSAMRERLLRICVPKDAGLIQAPRRRETGLSLSVSARGAWETFLSRRRIAAPWRALLLICVLAWLPGFFTLPPLDRDESRFAQATKQMLETRRFHQHQSRRRPALRKAGRHLLAPGGVHGGASVPACATRSGPIACPRCWGRLRPSAATFFLVRLFAGVETAFTARPAARHERAPDVGGQDRQDRRGARRLHDRRAGRFDAHLSERAIPGHRGGPDAQRWRCSVGRRSRSAS